MIKDTPVPWGSWDKGAFFVSVAILAFMVGSRYMPPIEGAFFPVVTKLELGDSSPEPPPSFRHSWTAEADKLRNCSYIQGSLAWYLGTPDNKQGVTAYFNDKPKLRGKGTLVWNALVIDLEPSQVLTNSFATVRHQCPYRWWETETVFYQSK